MQINILQNIEGAKDARGLAVIIDVFRAFSVECFLFEQGVAKVIPQGDASECLKMKEKEPDLFLVGERRGVKLPGFDCGNSPSQLVTQFDLRGKTVVHSTSAGTQGLVGAKNASEVLTGSFVNAKAISRYIASKKPNEVSLVCMGLNGTEESEEDTLCAEYIKSLLEGREMNLGCRLAALKNGAGKKFFDKRDSESFPEPDFFMCLMPNVFDFVLKMRFENGLPLVEKIVV